MEPALPFPSMPGLGLGFAWLGTVWKLQSFVRGVTGAIEAAGVVVIVGGAIWATLVFVAGLLAGRAPFADAYAGYRSNLGRAILLGLELLVAGDIIRTVAVDPTLNSVLVLGMIVLIRTFLSFSLEVEINGRWPWQNAGQARPAPGMHPSGPEGRSVA